MTDPNFKVAWKRKAAMKFAMLYNADHRRVLQNTNHHLSINPYRIADGIADFPGYPFNGYLWALISNVIIVYRVHIDIGVVSIETCYSALTGEVAELFFGISPDEDHEN